MGGIRGEGAFIKVPALGRTEIHRAAVVLADVVIEITGAYDENAVVQKVLAERMVSKIAAIRKDFENVLIMCQYKHKFVKEYFNRFVKKNK